MLEILLIIFIVKKLASTAEAKGRSKGWAALGVLFWFGGEVIGAVVILLATGDDGVGMYLGALVVAGLGAGAAFLVVNSLPASELALEAESADY